MAKYTVHIGRATFELADIEIMADSPEAAEAYVTGILQSGDTDKLFSNVEFEVMSEECEVTQVDAA